MFDLPLLPEILPPTIAFALVMLSLLTSLITASIGIGGGTIMLAVLAQVLPVKAIIPIHGVVQLGSNFGRSVVMRKDINWNHLLWFSLGSLAGALLGGQLVVSLPVDALRLILGGFILYSVWGPKFSSSVTGSGTLASGGFLSTLLTMFVGATGPFVLALLRAINLPRLELVATNAACMVVQHFLKVLVFGLLGFAFAPYFLLVLLMVVSGFLGTIMGKRILLRVNEKKFQLGVNVALTVLALRLLASAVN